MLLVWLSPGQTCTSSRELEVSHLCTWALDAAPLSKVAVCSALCLVPNFTSLHVWDILEWCLFILFHLCYSPARCFLLISCVALHISYSIQMLCQLIFVPALHRVKAVKTKIVTNPHTHTHTLASTPTHLVHAHKHIHTHTQAHKHKHTHIFALILYNYLILLGANPLCMEW